MSQIPQFYSPKLLMHSLMAARKAFWLGSRLVAQSRTLNQSSTIMVLMQFGESSHLSSPFSTPSFSTSLFSGCS